MEPKAPLACGGEAPTAGAEFFTLGLVAFQRRGIWLAARHSRVLRTLAAALSAPHCVGRRLNRVYDLVGEAVGEGFLCV